MDLVTDEQKLRNEIIGFVEKTTNDGWYQADKLNYKQNQQAAFDSLIGKINSKLAAHKHELCGGCEIDCEGISCGDPVVNDTSR
jgi:hypothetical protein